MKSLDNTIYICLHILVYEKRNTKSLMEETSNLKNRSNIMIKENGIFHNSE